MTPKFMLGLGLIGFALLIGGAELGTTFNKGYGYVIVAGVATAFLLSMATNTGSVMATSDKGGEAVEWEGFGQKAKVPTKALTGANLLIVGMFIVILAAQWQMFALLGKVVEALDRNTYMLSLNQADREAMRPMMPQSFQRFRNP